MPSIGYRLMLRSNTLLIIIVLYSGIVVAITPASAQILSEERLNVELAQMDVIAQCDAFWG